MTWLYRLLTDDVRPCYRCHGSGDSPVVPDKGCWVCLGSGLEGPGIVLRGDNRVERVCIHGVGHTIATLAQRHPNWVHGCCGAGCCAEYRTKENA